MSENDSFQGVISNKWHQLLLTQVAFSLSPTDSPVSYDFTNRGFILASGSVQQKTKAFSHNSAFVVLFRLLTTSITNSAKFPVLVANAGSAEEPRRSNAKPANESAEYSESPCSNVSWILAKTVKGIRSLPFMYVAVNS